MAKATKESESIEPVETTLPAAESAQSALDNVQALLNEYRIHPNATGENLDKAHQLWAAIKELKPTIVTLLEAEWPVVEDAAPEAEA